MIFLEFMDALLSCATIFPMPRDEPNEVCTKTQYETIPKDNTDQEVYNLLLSWQ